MADQDFIRIGTVVDVSGIQSGMAQAVQVNKAALDQLKADYAAATAEIKQKTLELAETEAAINEQLGAGASKLGGAMAASLQPYRAAIAQAQAAQESLVAQLKAAEAAAQEEAAAAVDSRIAHDALAGSITKSNAALLEEAATAAAASAALSAAAGSTWKVNSAQVEAMMSARILTSEAGLGGLSYALSRAAAGSATLGPLLQAAMPVALAGAMVLAVDELGKKAIDLYRAWDQVYQAQDRALKEGIELTKELHKEEATLQTQIYQEAERIHGKTFSIKLQLDDKSLDVFSNDANRIKQIDEDIAKAQERIKAGAGQPVGELGPDVMTSPTSDAKQAAIELETLNMKRENAVQQQRIDNIELAKLGGELAKSQQEDDKKRSQSAQTAANARIDAINEEAQAVSLKESDFRQADQNALTDLRLADRQKGDTERQFLADKLKTLADELKGEMAYSDRVREIRSEIAASQDEYANKEREALEKAAAATQEHVKKEAEYQEKLREIAKDSEKIWQSIVAAEAKATADQARARATGQEESRVGASKARRST